jgi:3-oxoacyl-[acyl-carrier-protein] synthase-3
MPSINSNEIYIASISSYLANTLHPIQSAILSGQYSNKDASEMEYESISVITDDVSILEMAQKAATNALIKANIIGKQLEILTFNSVNSHGNPQLWCPASYIQRILCAEEALPLSINQGCNGQLLSIALISQILISSKKKYGLTVAADKFSGTGINRWHGDYGIVYGDAATAVVLSRVGGIAKIISLETVNDPELEELHRFDEAHNTQDNEYFEKKYNVRLAKKEFLKNYGKDVVMKATQSAMKKLWKNTFIHKEFVPADVKYFIFPNLAKNILDNNYFSIHSGVEKKSLWKFGKTVGHLGASDCIAGLSYLFENNKLISGDKVLCVGAGAGFSWSFMLIEIV